MKVVHITFATKGGAGIAALRLHNALLQRDISSTILCHTPAGDIPHCHQTKYSRWHKFLESRRLGFFNGKYKAQTKSFKKTFEALSFPESIYDISNEEVIKKADIVHLHWVGNMLNYQSFFTKINKPVVWTLHDMNPFYGFSHYDTCWQTGPLPESARQLEEKIRKIKVQAYRACDSLHIVCLCNWMKEKSSASQAFATRPHYLIRNCIDTNTFTIKDKKECRRALNLPEGKTILLFVANSINDKRKGLELLIKALPVIHQRGNFCVVCVGADTGFHGGNVISMGKITNPELMAQVYNAADIFTIPSIEDNLPNTILESLACGTPVVGFPVGGIVDLIQDGVNGCLASDDSVSALTDAICKCSDMLPEFDRQKIADKAGQEFSPSKIAQDYERLYQTILTQSY